MDLVRKTYAGFTLLEILVVICIFTLVVSGSLLQMQRMLEHYRFENQVMQMYHHMVWARNRAMNGLVQTRIRLYTNYNGTGNGACLVQELEGTVWVTKKTMILSPSARFSGITLSGGGTTQYFTHLGIPQYTGNIAFQSQEKKLLQIVFYSSGRIRVRANG